MRRQLGADAVDLDTREGIARYALVQPRTIDTADVERALYGAGYTLVEMRIEISGTIVRRPCERCGSEVAFLQADGTNQLFELTRAIPQLNVFIMGFGVKILLGFSILTATVPFTIRFISQRLGELDHGLMGLLGALG